MKLKRLMSAWPMALAAAALATVAASPAMATTVSVSLSGTASPQTADYVPSGTADATQAEFAGQMDNDDGSPGPYPGIVTNRSLSKHSANGVSVNSGKKAKSNPQFNSGFEGLNLYQQRYARGGNQFTVEPPDQALCVGNGYVVEAVNDVLNIFNTSGQSVLPDNTATNIVSGFARDVNHAVDLNSFFGYGPAINRSSGVRAQEITDPTCLFDAATQRFYLVVLTLETRPNGSLTTVNHLDLAVSQSANPTGVWNIYRIDVTNDGSNIGGLNAGPYLGDYPHIGADAYGIYLTTNAYPWFGPGFGGAQIYALSKAQLAGGSTNVMMVHLDTTGMVNAPSDVGATQPGFTVWPAQSPAVSSFSLANGGTQYFLSSNAADEATHPSGVSGGNYTSNQVVVWTLKNTSSLNTTSPSLQLSTALVNVGTYAVPPKQIQSGSGSAPSPDTPQGHCLNDATTLLFNGQSGCWRLLVGSGPSSEVVSRPDSNDTRMQQVMYANGKLWGALDTAINPDGGGQRAGIAWYAINPSNAKLVLSGYLGAAGYDFTYPAIGVTASGRGVIGFSATGDNVYPSAAYAPIDASLGVGAWTIMPGGQGAADDDGFTGYKAQVGNPPRTRFGDYGAAAVDGDSVWLASEYVAQACSYVDWGGPFFAGGSGDNLLGTCAGTAHGPGKRTALGNWSTRISRLTP